MKKNKILTLGLLISSMAISTVATAKFIDEKAQTTMQTHKMEKKYRDDDPITLKGSIIRQIDHDTYLFQTTTFERPVKIEIDEHIWKGRDVKTSDVIEIQGEVEARKGKIKYIDVKDFKIIEGII